MRVLCVDNDPRILQGMQLVLEGWNCQVRTHSGSKSLDGTNDVHDTDILLADYHLDGENGLDLIREVRRRAGLSLPAVLITADRSNEVREAAEAMDVTVISKPVKPAVLRSAMTRLRRMTAVPAE